MSSIYDVFFFFNKESLNARAIYFKFDHLWIQAVTIPLYYTSLYQPETAFIPDNLKGQVS